MGLPKVVGKQHLRFYLEQNGRMIEGIGVGMAERITELQKCPLSLRVAFTPQVSGSSIQLLVRDFQIL